MKATIYFALCVYVAANFNSKLTFANAGQDCEIEALDGVLYSTCDLTSIDKKQLSTQAELTEQLAALTSRIGDVEADQITLASRLTDLEGRTDNNTDSIQTNTAAHGTNADNIAANTGAHEANAVDIDTNTGAHEANADNIAANTDAHEANTNSIQTNTIPSSCAGFKAQGETRDGMYDIRTNDGIARSVYCINSKFGGGWTLILRGGISVDMTNNEYSAARDPENLNAITDPGLHSFYKYSTSDINMLRTSNTGASDTDTGYWVVTPSEGTDTGGGLGGADIFHPHGCEFGLMKTTTEVKASPYCADSKDAYTDSWCPGGGHWHHNNQAYRWAFGYCNGAENGGANICVDTGAGMGALSYGAYAFHMGWCGTGAWGLIFVR